MESFREQHHGAVIVRYPWHEVGSVVASVVRAGHVVAWGYLGDVMTVTVRVGEACFHIDVDRAVCDSPTPDGMIEGATAVWSEGEA